MPDYESYDFSGGVNKRLSPLVLMPNELADAQNVLPEERGAIQRRYGFTKYNATEVVASKKILGLLKFYGENLDDMLVAACDTKVWNVPATGASVDLGLTSGFTIDSDDVFMVQHRDRIYGTAWDNDTASASKMFVIAEDPQSAVSTAMAWPMGQPPANAPVITAGSATGSLTEGDTFYYAYAFQYGEAGALGEMNASPTSAQFTVTSTKKAYVTYFGAGYDYLTAAAALDAGVHTVSIYRTNTTGTTLFWLADVDLADAGAGSALFYTDDGAVAVTESVIPETDNYGRHAAKYLCINNDQMFFGHIHDGTNYHPTMVQWAPAGSPDIRRANNYTSGSSEHGAVMGLATLNGTVYVFYESAIGALTVYDGANNLFRIVTTRAGVKAPKSLVVGKEQGRDVAFFLSYDHQVYTFDGTQARPVSDDIQPILSTTATQTSMAVCAGGWDGEYYYLSYPSGAATAPTHELRYNTQVRKMNENLGYDTGTWWPMVLTATEAPNVYHQLTGASDVGELYWGNAYATGYIFQHNSGNSDNGATIASMYQTGLNHLGASGIQKRFRTMLFDTKSKVAVTVRWDIDFNEQAGTFVAPDNISTLQYDTGLSYDDGHYYIGDIPQRKKYPFDSHQEGNRFRVKVTATESNAPYTVYGWTLRFVPVREDEPS